VVLWVVGGAVAVVGVLALVEALRGREREGPQGAAARPAPADPAVVERPLADASALAAEGRYGEAVHQLLLRLLGELSARTTPALSPALTSREIVARVALPPPAREPLAHLVSAVETTHFGGAIASREDYERCLERYRAFAAAYAAPAA
jgi:hypothetical protein